MSLFHNNALLGASGSGGDPIYVDDVFSTFLYEGNGSTGQTINNGIDLSGEGGMVWIKDRDAANSHAIYDTERGVQKVLKSDDNVVEDSSSSGTKDLHQFNSNGFSIGEDNAAYLNTNNNSHCSWTFRKTPGFFDIVTYTGNGTAGRTVSHNLGSTPGCIMIKCLSHAEAWVVFHRSLGATTALRLNLTQAKQDETFWFNDTAPTSSEFTLGASGAVNDPSRTYVAYLFAHDDQSFGDDSDEAIIKCGSFTSTSSGHTESLGFEPQWLLAKRSSGTEDWILVDNMRGFLDTSQDSKKLRPNTNNDENTAPFSITNEGFKYTATGGTPTYVYTAIRRPHKPPTAGTDVFKAVTYSGSSSAQNITGAGFAPDWMWSKDYGASNNGWYHDRLRGVYSLDSSGTGAEQSRSSYVEVLGQDGINFVDGGFDLNRSGSDHVAQFMKRAPGFFDIVVYTGDGSGPRNITHNLGVIPEFIISKNLTESRDWRVWHKDLNGGGSAAASYNLKLNSEDAQSSNNDIFGGSSDVLPTSSVYTVGGNAGINENGSDQVAWLFASLEGISRVGSYSGSSSAVTVDCGFAAAPRYILIKAINRSEPWYVFDHARGIVAGGDPYLKLNTTGAQNTGDDVIDPTSSGFTVNTGFGSGFNESGNTYIFFAIA